MTQAALTRLVDQAFQAQQQHIHAAVVARQHEVAALAHHHSNPFFGLLHILMGVVLVYTALLVAWSIWKIFKQQKPPKPSQDTRLETLKHAYARDGISLEEFERRLDAALRGDELPRFSSGGLVPLDSRNRPLYADSDYEMRPPLPDHPDPSGVSYV